MRNIWPARVFAIVVLAASSLGSPSLFAEDGYYMWKDAKGRPQHSDRPPPAGVEYEFVSTDTGMRRRVTAEESRANAENGGAPAMPSASTPTPTAAEEQAAVEKNPALCDQAKANLDTLNSKARVRIRDDEGIRYLTDEEKEAQRQRARDLIAVHCGA